MSPDRLAPNGMRLLRGPAARMSPAAAVALWAATAVLWYIGTQPGEALAMGQRGGATSLEQLAVLFSTLFGVAVLLAGLFAIGAYLLHWPAIIHRETRQQLELARAELADLKREPARVMARVENVQRLYARIAALRSDLARHDGSPTDARRVMESGRELVDDLLSELEAAGASGGSR
jgi:hypothetical protein